MHVQRIMFLSTLLMLAGCETMGGDSMPTLTRTGEVKDVVIGMFHLPISVRKGWVDERYLFGLLRHRTQAPVIF